MAKRVQKASPSPLPRTAAQAAASPDTVERIAGALERLAPRAPEPPRFAAADAFSWHPDERRLVPVAHVNRVEMSLLKGIDRLRDVLLENTQRFARGLPANNALLWGARGMGKSSLVKAVHAAVNVAHAQRKTSDGLLKLIEIHREDIESLPDLMALMRGAPYRFIVFCDDLSFEAEDTSYKSLKAMLEGGIEGRPDNVARIPSLQPGRIFGNGGWLSRPLSDRVSARENAPGGAGMGDHAGGALGARRLAIRPRPRGPTWSQA